MVVKRKKLSQNCDPAKRHFNKGTRAANDDDEVDKISASDNGENSDGESENSGEKLQEGGDVDSGSSENDVNEDDSDSDEEPGRSENSRDKNEETDSEEETEHSSHKKLTPSKKQKTLTKQHTESPDVKKVTKQRYELPKFQGTSKEDEKNAKGQKNDSSARKRKKDNKDPVENEDHSAKKFHALDNEIASTSDKRREERDARSLFLKNLPPKTTAEMLKNLSPEIITVRIPLEGIKNPESLYAFVEFENEDAAERNYKKLAEKQIDNKKFIVDYCGEKSKFRKAVKEYPINARRLFIPNVPVDISADELKQTFPEAKGFTTKLKGTRRLVFMSFETEDKAKEVFTENANLVIRGKKITVLYAFKKKPGGKKRNPRNQPKIVKAVFEDVDGNMTNKAQKVETKAEDETISKVMKTKKKSKKHKSNFKKDKMNSKEHKPIKEKGK